LKTIKVIKIIALFKRYIAFLKFGTPALFTSSVANQSLFFLISIYLNATILGFVSLILRLVSIPSSFLSQNLGSVFYQEISLIKKENSYVKILNFTKKLTLYSFLVYLIVYIFLENYFILIFGEEWKGALVYIKYLVLVASFSFVFSPLSMLFNYFEIQRYNFIWQFVWLLSNIAIFILYEYLKISIEMLFLIYALKQSVLYFMGVILFLVYAKRIQVEK